MSKVYLVVDNYGLQSSLVGAFSLEEDAEKFKKEYTLKHIFSHYLESRQSVIDHDKEYSSDSYYASRDWFKVDDNTLFEHALVQVAIYPVEIDKYFTKDEIVHFYAE